MVKYIYFLAAMLVTSCSSPNSRSICDTEILENGKSYTFDVVLSSDGHSNLAFDPKNVSCYPVAFDLTPTLLRNGGMNKIWALQSGGDPKFGARSKLKAIVENNGNRGSKKIVVVELIEDLRKYDLSAHMDSFENGIPTTED